MVEAWRRECEAELAAARAGQFRESAQQFLVSSWQGDALQVGAAGCLQASGLQCVAHTLLPFLSRCCPQLLSRHPLLPGTLHHHATP